MLLISPCSERSAFEKPSFAAQELISSCNMMQFSEKSEESCSRYSYKTREAGLRLLKTAAEFEPFHLEASTQYGRNKK